MTTPLLASRNWAHKTPPRGGSPDAPPYERVALSARQLWIFFAASLFMIFGLQLDAYAHATEPELETFFTPWHGVMYTGIFACGLVLGWFVLGGLKQGAPSLIKAIPEGLQYAVVGMALLLVSGAVDTVWHVSFGIEKGLEILVSPSHLGIIAGMFLVGTGPLVAVWRTSLKTATKQKVLVVASATLGFTTLHIISVTSSLGGLYFGEIGATRESALTQNDAVGVLGYLLPSILLVLPVVWLWKRFQIGVVATFFMTLVPAMTLWFQSGPASNIALPLLEAASFSLGCALAGPVAAQIRRSVARRASTAPAVETVQVFAMGVLGPAFLWLSHLLLVNGGFSIDLSGVTVSKRGEFGAPLGDVVTWNVHVVVGVFVLSAIGGALAAGVSNSVLRMNPHVLRSQASK